MFARWRETLAFDLSRNDAEKFCEAGNCYIDKEHINACFKKKKLDVGGLVRAMILLDYDSQVAFATARNLDEGTVSRWANGDIPRERLLEFIPEFSDEDKRLILAEKTYHYDAVHLNQSFEKAGDHSAFIKAAREMYGIKTDGLNVTRETLQRHQRGDNNPTVKTMVTQFLAIAKDHPEFKQCWDTYKRVCQRSPYCYGNVSGKNATRLFKRRMDEELASQERGV